MGRYLDSKRPLVLYEEECAGTYFVDKSAMLEELFPLIGKGNKYLCITRPRRFGKTVMANMISAFLGRGQDSRDLFSGLAIGTSGNFDRHVNRYPVLSISMNEIPRNCSTYEQYISRLEKGLVRDLKQAWPGCVTDEDAAVWDILNDIFEADGARFVFVIDEWDYIFHRDFVTEKDKESYLDFLRNLLKGQPYVELAYMTGILPIAKYSSGSELNMFLEYTMVSEEKYGKYFGFTESEVDVLYGKYVEQWETAKVSREGLRIWYDGYHTRSGERVYNPRSVSAALLNNHLGNYWTSSGPYDEIFYYIRNNIGDVRDALALLVSGLSVPVRIQEYAAVSMKITTRDEIFSAMVVYGFLSYEHGQVKIPNKELMDRFRDMLEKESSLGYVYRLAKASDRMLKATLAGDTETMTGILELVHDTESPLLSYNHETELTAVVNLVYLSARDIYRMEREDKAGIGYVDFIFYPIWDKDADGIILELKVDSTPDEAIHQIMEKKYALRFCGKLAEEPEYTGRILAVGITYDRKTKKHMCKIETIREKV